MGSDNQKIRAPQPGMRNTAERERAIIQLIKRLVIGGKGIAVSHAGDRVIVELQGGGGLGARGPKGDSGDDIWYEAESKSELPNDPAEVKHNSWARIIGNGSQAGMICHRNRTNTDWNALNFWE